MNFQKVKTALKEKISNTKYFDNKTFQIIMKDRETAEEIVKSGGNAQDFYKISETSKTKFYRENSGAYCELLSILAEQN